MKVLYFDCFSGISGDMTLGALLDLGVSELVLISELDKLKISGYDIQINKKVISGIFGTDFTVILNEKLEERKHVSGTHHSSRTFKDIKELIKDSSLSIKVKKLSIDIFTEIARAEARVHNEDINEVHFHEVGAIDSIVDIVGVAICIEELGVERVYSSALHDGQGFIKCQHGEIPVPVPAVMEMLRGTNIPLITEQINTELITPTGMGIIKILAHDFGNMPAMNVEGIGYGFGKRNTGRLNALRVVIGSVFEEDYLYEEIVILDTNIDDMNPEIVGYTSELLFKKGALDVFFTPIFMKKNRPAYKMSIVCSKDTEKEIVDCIFSETSTLGIRRDVSSRYILNRESVDLDTELGKIRCKFASKGLYKKMAPEYEDCKKIAIENNLTLKYVYDIATIEIKNFLQGH